jgi:hypothetical protein
MKRPGLILILVASAAFAGSDPTFVGQEAPLESQRVLEPPLQVDPSPVNPEPEVDTYDEDYPLGRGTPGLAFLPGAAFINNGGGWDAGVTVALRYYFPRIGADTSGPEALSPWSMQLGYLIPHAIRGAAGGSIDQVIGARTYEADIESFSEAHLAMQYRWKVRWPIRMIPEISLGVGMAMFQNDLIYYSGIGGFSPEYYTDSAKKTQWGPVARLGLPLFANDWFALRCEAGYVNYPNKVEFGGETFDLSVKGLAIYPSFQVAIGYLRPEVSKGVVLPNSAIPVWAIAALQTEKRSPIIAASEALKNAPPSGGLSGNVLFQYKNSSAKKVELVGDFNSWTPEPMYIDQDKVWITVKDLPSGTYRYNFVVNGKREIRDPWNKTLDPSRRTRGASVFVVPPLSVNR